MHKIHLACAVLGTAASLFAQCSGGPPAATFSTRDEFASNFYYGSTNSPTPPTPPNLSLVQLFDLTVGQTVTIPTIRGLTYDSGAGIPPTPNQVGAVATVKLYTCATTWTGNQNMNPSTTPPGAPWTLVGTGSMTVVASPAESVMTFTPPISIGAGTYGCALEYLPTTSGPAPGCLHTLGLSPNNILTASDQFLSLTNQGIQQGGWTTGVNINTGINLRFNYTALSTAAYSVQFGDGCYFHPQAFYQDFAPSLTTPSLANTGMQMVPLGPNNYVVVPTPSTIVPPSTPSITLGAPTATSSVTPPWDDAYLVENLPFTFPYAGGSTNVICIGSNGYIFLDTESSASFAVCGACYGSIATFRDHKGRICPFFHDLDVSAGGGIFYEPDPSATPTFVTITWQNVPEFGHATALNTFQLKLNQSGLVEINYGALANTDIPNGNNAIAGFTPGNGARLPASQNLVATMPFQTGDGSIPPVLGLSVRPVLGTTTNIVTTNITPGTLFVFLVTGFTTIPSGVNLAPIGMPGCFQYVQPISSLVLPVIGGQASNSLFIPNVPAFTGTVVASQSAPLTPGLNAAGILASNGLCMKITGL